MLGVDPEIVNLAAAAGDEWDFIFAIPQRGERVAVALVRRAAELLQRVRSLRLDPRQGAGAVDLFEPEEGVVVGGF